jgi:hypothetical protein
VCLLLCVYILISRLSLYNQIGNKRLKVQHKQIRRQDLNDQDSLQDSFGGGNYQRYGLSSLPPSGPNANQHVWFDNAHGMASGEGSLEHPQQQSRQDDDSGMDGKSSPTGDVGGGVNINDNEQASPLANLSQLQNALPDIPAKVSTA